MFRFLQINFLLLSSSQLVISTCKITKLSDPNFCKFGCPFINDKYELSYQLDDPSIPIYGVQPVPSLHLSDRHQFESLIEDIKKVNVEIIERTVSNSVDNLLELFHHWVSVSDRAIFFDNSYKPKLFRHSPAVGLPINLLDRISLKLKKKWPSIRRHVYLSAVKNDMQVPKGGFGNLDKSYLEASVGKKQHRLIATLLFTLNGIEGHILLDPAHAVLDPIVLMTDMKPPTQNNELTYEDGTSVIYEVLKGDERFITVRNLGNESFADPMKTLHSFIFVGRPFCSYLNVVERVDLLNPVRVLSKRNANGVLVASVTFNVLAALETRSLHSPQACITVQKLNPGRSNSSYMEMKVYPGNFLSENIYIDLRDKHVNFLSNVNELLGFGPGELYHRMIHISEMMNNKKFLQYFSMGWQMSSRYKSWLEMKSLKNRLLFCI